jgi:hypothetical protein
MAYNPLQKTPINPYWWNPFTAKPKNMLNEKGIFQVSIKDQFTDSIDLYAHIDKVQPAIIINTSLYDEAIVVDSIASVAAGDVIVIYEGCRFYQSIVLSAAVLTINLASPLDFAFTTAAVVHIGTWNLTVNGSVTPQIAHIFVPSECEFNIYQINVSITDDVVMDSAKFGGIAALTNGILFRVVNSTIKNLPLVVNNIGFSEQGFDINYDDKAPAGVYGFQAKKNYPVINGVSLRLNGATNDEIQCLIRDDLTDLTMLNITINGHVAQD